MASVSMKDLNFERVMELWTRHNAIGSEFTDDLIHCIELGDGALEDLREMSASYLTNVREQMTLEARRMITTRLLKALDNLEAALVLLKHPDSLKKGGDI